MTDDSQFSRRELFRGNFAGRTELRAAGGTTPVAGRFPRSFPVLRPPGAIEEEAFLVGCTQCQACIEACPHDSLRQAPPRFRRAAGTPTIDPIQQPCWMCTDFPCIPVCEPRVLQFSMPKKMGIAQIDAANCLPHQGRQCSRCIDACPVPNAIMQCDGKPKIVEEICTGCGVCQFVCPAPDNAILLMPLSNRPLTLSHQAQHVQPE